MATPTHKLSPLPYGFDALEPHLDAKTLEVHFTKHHQGYVDGLNKALKDPAAEPYSNLEIEELLFNIQRIPAVVQIPIRNNAGGHFNHTLYWNILTPKQKSSTPVGDSAKAISETFGGFEKFKEAFNEAGMKRFASGWAWLIVNYENKLEITQTPYHDCPLMDGVVSRPGLPIMVVDVWEHAYYLKFQNRRADYLEALWNLYNWEQIESYYQMAMKAATMSTENGSAPKSK